MALQKQITNLRTGHINEYWRVDAIAIDRPTARIQIVAAGYASADASQHRQSDDRRDWVLGGAGFAALAGRTLLTDLRSAGHPVDSWPAEIRAALGAETTYNVIARGAYDVIRTTRRPMPVGATMAEDGSVTLPTGEVILAGDIEGDESAQTVPSEFAGAVDV